MDVRASLNSEDNFLIETKHGDRPFVHNASFSDSPQATSTVGRTKSRRFLPMADMGSFLDDPLDKDISSVYNGARPKVNPAKWRDTGLVPGNQSELNGNDGSDPDGVSSLGLINVDDLDLSSIDLLLAPLSDVMKGKKNEPKDIPLLDPSNQEASKGDAGLLLSQHMLKDSSLGDYHSSRGPSSDSNRYQPSSDSIPHHTSSDSNPSRMEASSGCSDSNPSRMEASSGCSSGQDSKPDQPFAVSNLGTVRKVNKPHGKDAGMAIRSSLHHLFGEEMQFGVTEEHSVELSEEDVQALDAEFSELYCSGGEDSDGEEKTPENKRTSTISVDDIQIDSIFLRPGVREGEETVHSRLPYLSKVSLFEGGSGSELDTEDELEMVRKGQGMRHEAAGEDSYQNSSRPGLVGGSYDDMLSTDHQLPITQRQSAEGDVVSSPVPGDGGGGGDGSSGTESDDGRRSNNSNPSRQNTSGYSAPPSSYHSNLSVGRHSVNRDQEQRIRPMGDDLLSEICFTGFSASTGTQQDMEDSRLPSRYLAPGESGDNTTQGTDVCIDDFLSSVHQNTAPEFDPGNRLEASGFNVDDVSTLNSAGQNFNPFGAMASSFGSFGLDPDSSHGQALGLDEWSAPGSTSLSGAGSQPSAVRGTSLGARNLQSAACGTSPGTGNQPTFARGTSPGAGNQQTGARGTSPGVAGEMDYAGHSLEHVNDSWDGSIRSGGLGKRGAGSGSPSRGSTGRRSPGSDSPSNSDDGVGGGNVAQYRPLASPVSGESAGFASKVVDPERGSKTEPPDVFKKPTMPAPKAVNVSSFSKSTAKPRVPPCSTGSADGQPSGIGSSSRRSSASSERSEYVDLAYRMSLTGQAEEQREGLRRVPSIGGTTIMDMSIPNDAFFNNDAALEMLDADEVDFEKENVIRQDDAMADTGSPNDSWAYKSVMSVARPSWLDDIGEEGSVRISVGTFMMGRTEALGSLDTNYKGPRPDFGMTFQSPPRDKSSLPARLIEVEKQPKRPEQTRTSGVGQYGSDTPVAKSVIKDSQEGNRPLRDGDRTLTIQQLLDGTQSELSMAMVSALDLEALGIQLDETGAADSTIQQEISMIMKESRDINAMTQRLKSLKHVKSTAQSSDTHSASFIPNARESSSTVSSSSSATSQNDLTPKASQLPVRKGSGLSRCFPKVSSSEKSFKKSDLKDSKKGSTVTMSKSDSAVKRKSDTETVRDSVKSKTSELSDNESRDTLSKASSQEDVGAEMWSSPNTSSYAPSTVGLLDRLDDFNFAESMKAARENLQKNISNEMKNLTNPQSGSSDKNIASARVVSLPCDREQTPPPDGEDRLRIPQSSTVTVQNAARDKQLKPDSVMKQDYDRLNGLGKSDSSQRENRTMDSQRENRTIDGDRSRLNSSGMDHGYMPGHHIPDGTEYSERSDYAHMGHKGMLREEVAGVEDVGLAESRGFDVLKGSKLDKLQQSRSGSHGNETRSSRSGAMGDDSRGKLSNGDKNTSQFTGGRDSRSVISEDRRPSASEDSKSVTSEDGRPYAAGENGRRSARENGRPSASENGRPSTSEDKRSSAATSPVAGGPSRSNASMHAGRRAMSRRPEDLKTVETQTGAESSDKLESWTQTSLIFREGASPVNGENKTDVNQNRVSVSDNSRSTGNGVFSTNTGMPVSSGIPPKLPVTSFRHNLLEGNTGSLQEKPYLLTKTSLLDSDFAQENLKRDYSVEVLERIYASRSNPESFHQMNSTNSTVTHRESIESHMDWTLLKHRDTLDTVSDFPHLSDTQGQGARDGLSSLPPNFHSTPFPDSSTGRTYGRGGYPTHTQVSQSDVLTTTSSHNHPQVSAGAPGLMERNRKNLPDLTAERICVSPVEAPGVLKFRETCCVGISRKEVLPLKNPTDRWMECLIQVNSLMVDGQPVSTGNLPFEMRRTKVFIDPHKTEEIDVMFLPKFAGAYVAQVQVFSQSFLNKDDVSKSIIPVNVAFQAIAEDPWVKVTCGDSQNEVVDFGEMVWGSCREKTVCIRNMGHATVPLRLAITSNKAWHCFSFEPDGRLSDVSVISGRAPPVSNHGKSIINISLPGATQPFHYHEVRVWCRPPDKSCNRVLARQPPEDFTCNIDVDVDIPCSKFPKLASLRMRATVGVQKLHINNLQEIQLSAAPRRVTESSVKVLNAGNLKLDIAFCFTAHDDVFSVKPSSITLPPGVDTELMVAFRPSNQSIMRMKTLLLMVIQPEGPLFELKLQGDVIAEEQRSNANIQCDCTSLNFGGVSVGKTTVKRFRLINKEKEPVTMSVDVHAENIQVARSPEPSAIGSRHMDLYMKQEEIVPVYVVYSPSVIAPLSGKITLKPDNFYTKYTVKVVGYGGVSKLSCSEESTEPVSVRGYPCVGIQSLALERVKHVYIHNIGVKPAVVKVSVYKDLGCTIRMLSGQVVAQPSEFVVRDQERQRLDLVVSMTDKEFDSHCSQYGVGAVLGLSYHDQAQSDRPHRSQLVIGLIRSKRTQASVETTRSVEAARSDMDAFSTPSVSARTVPHTDISSRLQTRPENPASVTSDRSPVDNAGGWNVQPQQIVLYCSCRGSPEEMEKFCIYNTNNRDISFEVAWPGGMLSLTPDRGMIRARENKWIRIFPSTQASQHVDSLPWNGTVTINCDNRIKTLKVQIMPVVTDDPETTPDQRQLGMVSTALLPQHGVSSSNTLGNLRVSRTTVQFRTTVIGRTCEETIELTNTDNHMLRWMFSSFAAPYLKRSSDNKDIFRVSYKVFDFSRQFGKLDGQSTIQLTLQFMPRSTGTFCQYWDIQKTGNTSNVSATSPRHDFIRIQLTGEGVEENDGKHPSSVIDHMLPRLVSDTYKLTLNKECLQFPRIRAGEKSILKVELKNSHLDDVKVEVIAPNPPFFLRCHSCVINKKRYLRFPVEFQPSLPGNYSDVIRFQASKGENLVLQVLGECS